MSRLVRINGVIVFTSSPWMIAEASVLDLVFTEPTQRKFMQKRVEEYKYRPQDVRVERFDEGPFRPEHTLVEAQHIKRYVNSFIPKRGKWKASLREAFDQFDFEALLASLDAPVQTRRKHDQDNDELYEVSKIKSTLCALKRSRDGETDHDGHKKTKLTNIIEACDDFLETKLP